MPGTILKPRPETFEPEILDPEELIDVVDAHETEEPFTLEPFDELITMHIAQGKDFILARVTTIDPQDSNRSYYSYYAAHHLNKILFRTQPDQGLLHRMKAKNPLNNMTIVGDVHYYVIKHAENKHQEMPRNFEKMLEKSPIEKVSFELSKILGFETQRTLHLVMKPEALETPIHRKVSQKRRNSADDVYSDPPTPNMSRTKLSMEHQRPPSPVTEDQSWKIRSICFHNYRDGATNVNDWVRIHSEMETIDLSSTKKKPKSESIEPFYYAQYYASDDDYLMQAKVRTYFKEQALESTDAILFTISENGQGATGFTPHPALRNFAFSYQSRNGTIYGITRRSLRFSVIMLMIATAIITKILISDVLLFMVILIAIVLLTMLALLFIGS